MSKEEIARRIRERLEEGGETLYTVDENLVLVNMEFADLTNVFIDNIDVDAVFGSTRLDLEALHELKGDRDEIEADESRQRRAGRSRTREEEEEYEI